MTVYLIAQGWNATEDFAVLSTRNQPRVEDVTPGRTQWGGDQLQYADGAWDAALVFDALKDAEFDDMLDDAGLDYTTQSAKITIYLPHRDQSWHAWNAVISYPDAPHQPRRYEPARFPLKLVQEVSYTPDP
jgi:hypothetical protein